MAKTRLSGAAVQVVVAAARWAVLDAARQDVAALPWAVPRSGGPEELQAAVAAARPAARRSTELADARRRATSVTTR
jgi:hypothetical protein